MKRALYLLPLFASLNGYAGSWGPTDEALFIAWIVGFLLLIIAILETPRTIRKITSRMKEKRRLKRERLEAERQAEECHYFAGA
jgi:hypothetical protein